MCASFVASYVKEIAEALQYAHDEKVIHRDVKPENMLLGRRGEVVLTDFGIATLARSSYSMQTQNLADHNESLLMHLPDGEFVAYERACTHEGVLVNYDPVTKMLVCPLHGSIFDPARNGTVLQGPAPTPLPNVKVQINSDGTITSS